MDFIRHALMENRNGLAVATNLTHATGTAEGETTLQMLNGTSDEPGVTHGADKACDILALQGSLKEARHRAHYGTGAEKLAEAVSGRRNGNLECAYSPRII